MKVQADTETQERYDQLAEKRTEGQLTSEEQAELESIVRASTLLGVNNASRLPMGPELPNCAPLL